MNDECWKPVPGYEAFYEASSLGRIKSLSRSATMRSQCRKERVLKPNVNRRGYGFVGLWLDGKRKQFAVHRLVLMAFVGPCPQEMQACCHNDGNPRNNSLENLRWDTLAGNQADRIRHGTNFTRANHPLAKLRPDDVRLAAELAAAGSSHGAIAARFGVSRRAIGAALSGSTT